MAKEQLSAKEIKQQAKDERKEQKQQEKVARKAQLQADRVEVAYRSQLETDKVVLEVPAPADGKLIEIRCPTGAVVTSEDILGLFEAGQIAVESTAPEPGAKTTPRQTAPAPEPSKSLELPQPTAPTAAPTTQVASTVSTQCLGERSIRREPMSRLRQTIANRLLDAQHSAAILSTFNEVDLSEVMAILVRHNYM